MLRIASGTAAIIGIVLVAWWFVVGQDTRSTTTAAAAESDLEVAPLLEATVTPVPALLPTATPTPLPTPTPVPTPLPFVEAAPLGLVTDVLTTPLPDCGLLRDDTIIAGTVTLTCLEDWASVPVVASANGRVVHISTAAAVPATAVPVLGEPDNTEAGTTPVPTWSWAEQAQLGPHVVVDHGPLNGSLNTQTVYAGLSMIDETIGIGTTLSAGEPLGAVAGPEASLRFSVWIDNERQDGVRMLAEPPSADDQRAIAAALRELIASPTDDRCPLVLASGSLPGAARNYRNGTHQGIDFNCGAADRSAFSIADGKVVYLVDNYVDPTVAEREALLQMAGLAGFTPHWTLVMLYGNVVIVDHGEIPGAGRVVTISAHLEEIDPAITLGATVTRGQRLGEQGNRGTNASAQGIRGAADPSLHLHWELFIDNWYLGAGLDAGTTIEVMATALCGAAETAGCPG